jgi:tryptophanyl-tRNA synthetase
MNSHPQPDPPAPSTSAKPRVFSGVQPTSALHIGNYLGAVRQWAAQQDERDSLFCVVDLHALTIPESVDPAALHRDSRTVAALFFASGLDPDKNTVFIQSHLHEHAELAWILNCVTPLGWLYRMTQFKAKSEGRESVSTGLLDYPVLQAADILLYDADEVPVGEDQRQHIELTRDIAIRFNNLFGDTFVVPEVMIPASGARVMGLDEPEVKMSKSIAATRSGHAINLLDDERTVKKAIMSAVTDSERELRFEHASPGVRNLYTLHSTLSGDAVSTIEARVEAQGYGALKKELLGVVLDALAPIQARYREIVADPDALDSILTDGAERARALAAPVLSRVKSAIGVG